MQEKNLLPMQRFGNTLLGAILVGALDLRDPKADGENEKRNESGQCKGEKIVSHIISWLNKSWMLNAARRANLNDLLFKIANIMRDDWLFLGDLGEFASALP